MKRFNLRPSLSRRSRSTSFSDRRFLNQALYCNCFSICLAIDIFVITFHQDPSWHFSLAFERLAYQMFVASDPWTHSLRRDYSFISLSFHPFFSHACFLCRLAGCNRWNLKTFRLAVCSGFGLTMRYTFICSSLLSGLARSWSMNFSFRATVICLLFEKDVEAYIQCLAETLRITDEISIVQFSEASFCNRFSTRLASRYVLICIPVSFKLALQLGI